MRFWSLFATFMFFLNACQTTPDVQSRKYDGVWSGLLISDTQDKCIFEKASFEVAVTAGNFSVDVQPKQDRYSPVFISGTINEQGIAKVSLEVGFPLINVFPKRANTLIKMQVSDYGNISKFRARTSAGYNTTPCGGTFVLARAPFSTSDILAQRRGQNLQANENSTSIKLKNLKAMFDEGFINEDEYENRKRVFLDSVYGITEGNSIALFTQEQETQEKQIRAGTEEFGDYHALVIGINDYRHLPKLKTAVNDAEVVSDILHSLYGFDVELLRNPTRDQVMDAFDRAAEVLTEKDNLLIYFAGHGWLDSATNRGFWLTKDAQNNRRSKWISNATVTDTLRAVRAKHVMVVADSCYSGTLNRSARAEIRTPDHIQLMSSRKARVVLTSGGLEPVSDGIGDHSPFAKAFLNVLRNQTEVIDGTELFIQMRKRVMRDAQQVPEYSDIEHAGHDGGDFLFVRK